MWLERKYIDLIGARLAHFKWLRPTVATFRCPYCGDSQKSQSKTRGYLFESPPSWVMKCHNCQASRGFKAFLQDIDPEVARQYAFESFKETHPNAQPRAFDISESRTEAPIIEIPDLSQFPPEHPAVRYVRSRRIPNVAWTRLSYTEDWSDWLATLGWEHQGHDHLPRLLIPFRDRHGRLVAAQGRCLPGAPKGAMRYFTAKATHDVPKIFGIDHWSPTLPTFVCEGPLDALLVPNCLAAAGGDITTVLEHLKIPSSSITLIPDNEPRNADVVRQIDHGIDLGASVVIFPPHILLKDLTDMRLAGHKLGQLITAHTYSGMRAKLELSQWKRC